MALENFFNDGNKLCVFGSFIYARETASDLDFTIFTIDGRNPFKCAPQYSGEILEFLESKFGKFNVNLDFSGQSNVSESVPYNLSNLPLTDEKLDGYFLTGKFFPDNVFLKTHYKKNFGENFLNILWSRFSNYVNNFTLQGVRLDKRQNDMLLLLNAANNLTVNKKYFLGGIIEEYLHQCASLNTAYLDGSMLVSEYDSKLNSLIPTFISSVNYSLELK